MGGPEAGDSKEGHEDLASFQGKPNNKGQQILSEGTAGSVNPSAALASIIQRTFRAQAPCEEKA